MKLISIETFRSRYFDPESAPTRATVRRWILSKKVVGKKVGDLWYVDEHMWEAGDDELVALILAQKYSIPSMRLVYW